MSQCRAYIDSGDAYIVGHEPQNFTVHPATYLCYSIARFRVCKIEFNDVAKRAPTQDSEELLPMKIIGTISEPGLGLLSWWKEDNI